MIAHMIADKQQVQSIEDHLTNVGQIAEFFGKPLHMGYLALLTGQLHDLGKWRKRFEIYLRQAVSKPESVHKGEVNHSSAGAIYVYRRYYKGTKIQRLTAQLIATAILSHHGLMDCLAPDGTDHFHRRVESLENLEYDEVMENFQKSGLQEQVLDEYFGLAVIEVTTFMEKVKQHRLSPSFAISMLERMLLSMLIDADRLDTAIFCGNREKETSVETEPLIWPKLCTQLEKYLNRFQKDDFITKIRKQVSEECLQFAKNPTGIYKLAVPTGGAKTLGSLRFALHHAKRTGKTRVFYIGPFLSILEQNGQVFREALGDGDFILEHHSNVVMEENDDSEGYHRYQLLTENWDTPIVLTTFAQFLNALFSDNTQSVRRYHSLANSVIIIDEIQSLPIKMISMFNLAMNYLSHICDTTVILCSATQPILDSDKFKCPIYLREPADIITDTKSLYQKLKRVNAIEKKGNLSTEQLRDFVVELMEKQESLLLILNTKKAAMQAFLSIKQYYQEKEEPIQLFHLSTNMCGEHRLDIINKIKKNLRKEKLICVSTSLIEAGVDLSFSCAIRSFAGLDSIAQAAGRCNRNGEAKEGILYLIHYEEEYLGKMVQMKKGAMCSENIVDEYERVPERYHYDLLSPEALESFYKRYYFDDSQKRLMDYPIDGLGIKLLDLFGPNIKGRTAVLPKEPDLEMFQAFKSAGKYFEAIDSHTTGVIVPYGQGEELIVELSSRNNYENLNKILKKSQRFTVNLYRRQIDELSRIGAVEFLEQIGVLILKDGFYDEVLGVVYDGVFHYLEV